MSHEFPTICPHCDYHHDLVSHITPTKDGRKGVVGKGGGAIPDKGDVTICIRCGNWCIFDFTRHGGLRPPTAAERKHIETDPLCQKLLATWKEVSAKRGLVPVVGFVPMRRDN